ncbi:hypothetical protein [Streptomyces sp. SID14515]|uniref:hypothetical protein n=1 Tax=Streptomyces sp. SID14515 TaxID=2706074 RepID=UPI0013CB2CDE|nr:hypothetical protein [Streptomyces sp. SID14515]NEB42563.1 hypothetical protein [Streptomyces sp. SID14515]
MADGRNLLEKIAKAYTRLDMEREESFRANLRTYDPRPGDQPCEDWEMGEYDDLESSWAEDAELLLSEFVQEVRLYLGMESSE